MLQKGLQLQSLSLLKILTLFTAIALMIPIAYNIYNGSWSERLFYKLEKPSVRTNREGFFCVKKKGGNKWLTMKTS